MNKWQKIFAENQDAISGIFVVIFCSFLALFNLFFGSSLMVFLACISPAIVITFFYPRSGIYAVVFLTLVFERFFSLQSLFLGRQEIKLYPLDMILGAILLSALIALISRKIKLKMEKMDWLMVGFILLGLIYFIFSFFLSSSELDLAFSSLKYYSFYPLIYFLILIFIKNKKQIDLLLKFALVGATTIVLFIISGIVLGQGIWSEFTPLSTEGIRTLAFPHGFYIEMAIITLIIWLAFKKNKINSNFYLILIILWSIGIIGTMMRHIWIALGLTSIFCLWILPKLAKKNLLVLGKKIIFLSILIITLAFFLLTLAPNSKIMHTLSKPIINIGERVGSLASTNDESFSWRGLVWKEGLKEYATNPIFGIGFSKKIYVENGNYRDLIEVRNIHNSPLIVLIQMGIVAIVVFFLIIYESVKKVIKFKNWLSYALSGLLLNYLIIFLFQPYLETNLLGIFFWMILGSIRINQRYEDTGNQQI
ncbi:MAG: hypothetical protein COU40_01290 [Candidatus Moranbacteria bacterium CG10_big_fil_rev_8_21_14_0_10_35_21]|nr:MAG: hypothetical protein COU40_01290 [Candidatus Moranbacteria bacterium CG10_big_fil_rev_8_21_14_0_10_35_21]PJA88392.1 MAG: hypothetical protein CO139_03365 [Candidatus Moranbacteria bacterium CG_4_9_14_3_um_filter_36_9]